MHINKYKSLSLYIYIYQYEKYEDDRWVQLRAADLRWLALTTPITASLTQINYLQLPVTGMDSVRPTMSRLHRFSSQISFHQTVGPMQSLAAGFLESP